MQGQMTLLATKYPAMPPPANSLSTIHHHPSQYTCALRFLFLDFITMAAPENAQYLLSLFGLQGKTVLITGGTRGIGAGLTVAL